MRNFIVLFIFTCLILVSCALKPQVKLVGHQGQQVNINDTQSCLQCHTDMKDHSHPYMVKYPPPNKKGYAPLAKVKKSRISLVNNQVVCISCHDLTNPDPSHPIKGLNRSELCLVCHLK